MQSRQLKKRIRIKLSIFWQPRLLTSVVGSIRQTWPFPFVSFRDLPRLVQPTDQQC